jgi:hypothetical protein
LTIEWFERINKQHEALCLFLTANPVHRDLLAEFLRKQLDADIALGKNIGFIVSDSQSSASQEITTDHGRQFILPGEVIKPQNTDSILPSAFEGASGPGPGNNPTGVKSPSEVNAKSNQEWLDFFSMQKAQLPVLCVLIKGCDPVSICLNDDLSLPMLPSLLGDISDIVNHEGRLELHTISDFNRKIAKFSELSGRLVEKEKELINLFDTLVKISEANDQDRAKIAECISSRKFSPDEMKQFIKDLDFYISPEFKHRKAITGLMNKSRAIEKLLAELDEQVPSPSECESIRAAIDKISERRNNALSFIEKLAKDNFYTSSVDRNQFARKHDAYSIRIDAASNTEEKIVSMLSKHNAANQLCAKLMSFAGITNA